MCDLKVFKVFKVHFNKPNWNLKKSLNLVIKSFFFSGQLATFLVENEITKILTL